MLVPYLELAWLKYDFHFSPKTLTWNSQKNWKKYRNKVLQCIRHMTTKDNFPWELGWGEAVSCTIVSVYCFERVFKRWLEGKGWWEIRRSLMDSHNGDTVENLGRPRRWEFSGENLTLTLLWRSSGGPHHQFSTILIRACIWIDHPQPGKEPPTKTTV